MRGRRRTFYNIEGEKPGEKNLWLVRSLWNFMIENTNWGNWVAGEGNHGAFGIFINVFGC
jgi:hypothetical protein